MLDIPIHESTAEQQIVQEEHLGDQNMDENKSYDAAEVRPYNDHSDDLISTESSELNNALSSDSRRPSNTVLSSGNNVLSEERPLLNRSQERKSQCTKTTFETSL